jgi:hypothetical protein
MHTRCPDLVNETIEESRELSLMYLFEDVIESRSRNASFNRAPANSRSNLMRYFGVVIDDAVEAHARGELLQFGPNTVRPRPSLSIVRLLVEEYEGNAEKLRAELLDQFGSYLDGSK